MCVHTLQVLYRVAAAVGEAPGGGADVEAAQRLASTLRTLYGGGVSTASNLPLALRLPGGGGGGEGAVKEEGDAGPPTSDWKLGSPRSVLPAAVEVSDVEGMRGEPVRWEMMRAEVACDQRVLACLCVCLFVCLFVSCFHLV
jgi:hypothetical protein